MIALKEKVSMLAMKASMAVVVVLATVVKPAMNAVLDYKEGWRNTGEEKDFFARLRNVFDDADIPLSNIKTLNEISTTTKKPVVCISCGKNKELCDCSAKDGEGKKRSQAVVDEFLNLTNDDDSIGKALKDLVGKLGACMCCDCLEDCFCIDCPVHSAKMIDDTKTEIGGEAMHLEVPKQETVCCGCLGTDYCETCPVHGKTTHPVGICDVVGHDCSQVIEKRRISISGVPVGSKIEDLEVGDQVDIVDGAFANFKGRIVDILRPNNTIQLDVLIFGQTQKVMLSASQVKLNPKFAADTVFVANGQPFKGTGEKLKKERARKLVNDMIERKLFDANNPIAVENQVDEIMKWDDITFESMKRVVAKHNVPVKVEEHRSQLSKEIETVLQENLSKIDVNNKPRTFEELKDVIELQSDMNDLANDMLRKQVGKDTDLDRFIEMGEEAQEILNKSQWKQNFDTAFDRMYRNTKAAKQANKKKPANRKSSPANSGVGKNSRKPSAKTKKTTKAKKK